MQVAFRHAQRYNPWILYRNRKKAEDSCVLQSPDLAKVKEELSRLQKRLKAGTKLVEEKQKLHKEQSQLSAKLQADLENVTDGKGIADAFSGVEHSQHNLWIFMYSSAGEVGPLMGPAV